MMRTVLTRGTVLRFPDGNEYRIERLLGLGGSALLYEAKDVHSALYVALKELYPAEGFLRREGHVLPEGDTPDGWAALNARKAHMREREGELSQRASRRSFQVIPLRPPIYDTVDITLPDGTLLPGVANCYARMDSLREKGMTLRDFVDEYEAVHGSLPLAVMTAIMETVLEAYAALHTDGFLHGDCQTGNIFLLGANVEEKRVGVAHIIDFGSARELLENGKTAPVVDEIYSTDGYCAPELLRTQPGFTMTPACDVWSLGVVFLNLLTGEVDRWMEDGLPGLTEYLVSHPRNKTLRSSAAKKLGCSPAALALTNSILARALDNEPENRYPDAAAMAADLGALSRCLAFRWQEGIDRWLVWEAALRLCDRDPVLFRTEHVPQLVDTLPVKKLELLASLDGGKDYPVQDILRDLPEGKNLKKYCDSPRIFEEFMEELESIFGAMEEHVDKMVEREPTASRQEVRNDFYKTELNAIFQVQEDPAEEKKEVRTESAEEDFLACLEQFDDFEKDKELVGRIFEPYLPETSSAPKYWQGKRNLYLHAPGGAGKSYTVAEVLTRYLDSGEKLPLYLDLGTVAPEDMGESKPELALCRLLSRRYFGGEEAGEELLALLTRKSVVPGVCLVLDNLHKVGRELAPAVETAISNLHEKGGNTWLLVVGRAADPGIQLPHQLELLPMKKKTVQELVQQVWKEKPVPEELGGLRNFQKGRQEKMFSHDRQVLEAQQSTLGLPLFLMRYLEVFAAMPDGLDLPKGSGELLCRYFSQREYDANGREVHEFLTRHMPRVAAGYTTAGKSECSREEIEGWLRESCGRLRYRPEHLDNFLRQAVDNLAVLTRSGEEFRFVHDCYQEYFSAAAISEVLKQAVETGDVRLLEKINYPWPEEPEALWLTLCTLDASGGRVETICTTEDFERELLALLNSDRETARQCAHHIPMGVLRGHCSFWYPWSKLTEWLRPGKVFMADDPRVGVELKRPEAYMKWQDHLPWMELGAKLGDPELQYWYGRYLWLSTMGHDEIEREAIDWFRAAAQQNHSESQFLLAWHHRYGQGVPQSDEEATRWTLAAAGTGHVEALLWAGIFYELGLGVPKDKEASTGCYKAAAEAGHKEAQFRYGWACWEGIGRSKSARLAHYWFVKAAEGSDGHPEALYWLGYMYEHGDGVDEDVPLARSYYRQSARKGHPGAQYRTGRFYRDGETVGENKELAATWFERAAKQGYTKAMNALANLLIDGEGKYKEALYLEREPMEAALYWLEESHKQGNVTGTNNLGWMCLHGHGMAAPDYPRAMELFEKAARQGSANALKHLGTMYEKGLGVVPNPRTALYYYGRSADEGSPKGKAEYERLLRQMKNE